MLLLEQLPCLLVDLVANFEDLDVLAVFIELLGVGVHGLLGLVHDDFLPLLAH